MQRRLVYSFLGDQRYGCSQCGWCCCWWAIEVRPAELERLRGHDWAAESPRLNGVELFLEQARPKGRSPRPSTTFIAQIQGRCAFLEEDNRCLIHRVLGEEAKPAICRGFPLVLGQTPEGALVGANFACPSVIRNQGKPFSRVEGQVLDLLVEADGDPEGASALLGEPLPSHPRLDGPTRLTWDAYLRLEQLLGEILCQRHRALSTRAEAVSVQLQAVRSRAEGRSIVEGDEMRDWVEIYRRNSYSAAFLRAGRQQTPLNRTRRKMMARRIVQAEMVGHGGTESAADMTGCVERIVRGEGEMNLSTLSGRVALSVVEALFRAQGDREGATREGFGWGGSSAALRGRAGEPPAVPGGGYPSRCSISPEGPAAPVGEELLSRFLLNFVRRKSLLEAPSLFKARDNLLVNLYLARWYAAASAHLHKRVQVTEEDVVRGIQVVEKTAATRSAAPR